jgi:signal transduction histidine kinase
LEIQFAGISVTDAARIRFRYQLEGHDEGWLPETDLRLAFYTNLGPGKYRFKVQAANSHGLWNPTETTLAFVIQPFFWQTIPFYTALTLTVAGLGLLAHQRRLTRFRRNQELQHERAVFLEKNRLAADMHDALGAGLTRIAILGEATKSRLTESDETYGALDEMTQSARNVATGISELVWATNPGYESLEDLAVYLRSYAARQFEGTDMVAKLDFPTKFPVCQLSASFRRNLLLVWKEGIANVLKHSKATQVALLFRIEPKRLHLSIEDNGRGFESTAGSPRGNGLGNMQRRIQELSGQIVLSSSSEQGTRIGITVPLP